MKVKSRHIKSIVNKLHITLQGKKVNDDIHNYQQISIIPSF